nr:hydroxymethylglutaryl-CoA lyase [Rhizobium sp. P28RR-XV]
MARDVDIVEVGPRDGFQGIDLFIPTEQKISFVERAAAAGLKRIEVGSFVSAAAIPQLADTASVLKSALSLSPVLPQVLVPSEKRGKEAMENGARMLVFVLSVSEPHNRNNVRRTPTESAAEYQRLIASVPEDVGIRLSLATAFDCPFAGRVDERETLAMIEHLLPCRPNVEICLCDTTGRADPDHVGTLFRAAVSAFGDSPTWSFHGHDTYGMGLANVHAAFRQGVRIFDASFGGLGGCPFAPGATGNVATEDVVWMFERMGIATGIDFGALIDLSCDAAAIPGAISGGRAREALSAKRSVCVA